MVRKRFYCESYMRLGFRENVKKDGTECPQCVICLEIMAEESMKPAKLKLHLVKKHPECAHYSEEQFRELAERLRLTGTLFNYGFHPIDNAFLYSSYLVAFHIAKYKTPHTYAENLIKDCVMAMVNTKFRSKAAKQIEGIPLSDDSIKRRIDEMSVDVEDQGLQELKDSTHPFSLQIDESTDEASIIDANDKIEAQKDLLRDWRDQTLHGLFEEFEQYKNVLEKSDNANFLRNMIKEDVVHHLETLSSNLDGHFPCLPMEPWMILPFSFSIDDLDSNNPLKRDLIDLTTSTRLKILYESKKSLSEFWASIFEGFPDLTTKALHVPLPFVTTYLCETGFSALVNMKTKYRSQLDVSNDMRLTLSTTSPRIKRLVEKKWAPI